jgi:hypothetical protein
MFSMAFEPTRRRVTRSAAASLAGLLPRGLVGNASGSNKAVIHADQEIGVVGPAFHLHFAEPPRLQWQWWHLGRQEIYHTEHRWFSKSG